jgi:hypothetical protein
MFGISPNETKFERRGFPPADSAVQRHLESAGGAFVAGYNTALARPKISDLNARLNDIESMYRGFAFEGAAMALTLLDLTTPWNRRRFNNYLETAAGDAHWYMIHIGAGWAVARLPWARRKFERVMRRYHPLYSWLMLDGYGFHEGFFYTERYIRQQTPPRRLTHHARRVFDQGLGRSLWFSQGANVARIAAAVSSFGQNRQADLWSGVALAASYAGGVTKDALESLHVQASNYATNLAQGAAFAAKARQRAGNPVQHTEMASEIFCHMPADEAAAVTDECLENLPMGGAEPAYQVWRAKISGRFSLAGRPADRTMAVDPVGS